MELQFDDFVVVDFIIFMIFGKFCNFLSIMLNKPIFPCFQFAHFLLDCGTKHVCILHNGFNILHAYVPNVLITS